jgi:S-adenosylmethionine decarboxylase
VTGVPRLPGQGRVRQIAVTARGCSGALSDAGALAVACKAAAAVAGLQVVAEAGHAFTPHGATVALVLAESHVVVSTWPEYGVALIDLATCGPEGGAQALWDSLREFLQPASAEVRASHVDLTEGEVE